MSTADRCALIVATVAGVLRPTFTRLCSPASAGGRSSMTRWGRLSRLAAGGVAVAVATSACASTSSLTVIPLRGQEAEQVDRDRAQCDAIAAQARDRWAFVKTKVGAVIFGVAAGAALGLVSVSGSGQSPSAQEAPILARAAAVGAAVA